MKRSILFFLLVCNYSFSQVIISNDTTVCGNFNDTLYALSAIQSSMQVDDQHDVAVPIGFSFNFYGLPYTCLLYTSPSTRDKRQYRMPSSA